MTISLYIKLNKKKNYFVIYEGLMCLLDIN